MPGLIIHQSNHVERLVDALAGELAGGTRDPLRPATIVVQSRGMERWLCIELARRLGVLANARFPFPNTILDEIFTAVLGSERDSGRFEGDALAFRVMRVLGSCLDEASFAPLRDYVGSGSDPLRLYQLAQKLAGVYDQLATYRPGLINAWERGEDDCWHATLWQRLFDEQERRGHRPQHFERFMELCRQPAADWSAVPAQLLVFGIPTLPPLHLEVLSAAAQHVEVHIFLLNPCQEYWHDIASDKLQVKLLRKSPAAERDPAQLHFERGHPLLSAQGTLGQEFLNLLADCQPESRELFVTPGSATLLAALQTQILELRDPAAQDKRPIAAADHSIQVHSCHSPLREVEVLRDLLLRQMDEDPTLQPRDILVMAPEIESYAPYLAAVFDGEPLDRQRLPYSIADRAQRRESPAAAAFLKLLDLKGGRVTSSQVLELLEEPGVRQRCGLALDDLELVRHWVVENRISWGVDGAFKERLGLPALDNNTWGAGFDRLLLGFALPAGEQALFAGILPYDHVEGSDAAVLGRFHGFCQKLFAALDALGADRTLGDWGDFLAGLAEDFLETDTPDESFRLQRLLHKLPQLEELSGYRAAVPFEVLRGVLDKGLAHPSTTGFLRGGVTCCSLLPMRSIPFRVIALLGMNDAAFPRKSTSVSFDPLAGDPQKGDPSRRKEDRYLFLEALLSARDALLISYVGQSIRDNSEAPPSVLVAELLDALDQGFAGADGGSARNQLVTRHRLQGFNPAYFTPGERLFSYSRDNYRGALAQDGEKHLPGGFLDGALAAPADAEPDQVVELGQLVRFIQNPARYFLRQRLGLFIDDAEVTVEDCEPFDLDALANYQITRELVDQALAGTPPAEHFAVYAAKSVLPQGGLALPAYERCASSAQAFVRQLTALTGGTRPQAYPCDLTIGGTRLVGQIPGVYPEGLLHWRCAAIKPKDRLAAWVYHLALCGMAAAGAEAPRSRLLGSDGVVEFRPAANSDELLGQLLDCYREGLTRPLPFFPKSAYSYVQALDKGDDPASCLDRARKSWLGNEHVSGESTDPDFDFCFGRGEPLDAAFAELSHRIFGPLRAHQGGGEA